MVSSNPPDLSVQGLWRLPGPRPGPVLFNSASPWSSQFIRAFVRFLPVWWVLCSTWLRFPLAFPRE